MTTAAVPTIAHPIEADDFASRIDSAIRRFLDGENDGHAVLDALFGDPLDESVPARLSALVRER
jgi:hypothetical protein